MNMTPVRFGAVTLQKTEGTGNVKTLSFKLDGGDKNPLQHDEYQDTLNLSFKTTAKGTEVSYTYTTPPDDNPHPWAYTTWDDLSPRDSQIPVDSSAMEQLGQLLKKFAATAKPSEKNLVSGLFKQYGDSISNTIGDVTQQIAKLNTRSQSLQQEQEANEAVLSKLA